MSSNTQGALLMMGSMAAFTVNDTILKLAGASVPLFQLLFLRGVLASVFVFVLARSMRAIRWDLSRQDWVLIGMRTGAEVGAAYFFLTALFHMPLANATAILQMLPLSVTLCAALFFSEPVGWQRWSAIVVGFCGMLLIVQPGTAGFSHWSLYAVVAVGFVTLRDLTTRGMSEEVPSLMVTLSAAVGVMAFSGVASIGQGWVALGQWETVLLLGSGVFIMFAYLLSVMVMRVGEISATAPFRYSALVWALLLGWLVFGDWPSPIVLTGAVIVVATGLFTLYREARRRRKDIANMV